MRPRNLEEVGMNQLVDQVLGDLDLEIEEKDAKITVDKLFTIYGHHRQLQQAFQNLIGNAIKYSKPGVAPQIKISCNKIFGKSIGINLSPEEQQKEFYEIRVSDNGVGFEQQDAERIFNVFTRLYGNAEYKGTGVGLSIVRKVIENHHGYITAQSKPGAGATFSVLLPVENNQ
jgi:light-regulated signal transduction histidine kinase (bacteriophytochrome)